ncbi:uncharacterized protein odam [Hemibagrus wyckioides]|uniref:uncharacterized protein odam n=1 Tax=Hemibagrus wyckioides TaxID=337641 RepID=UPI00266B7EEC|nr:uncharacterized protein odam [Hemibagrus wyckioides]
MGLGQAQVQGSPFLSPFLIQSQPELLLPPQVLNLGPQVPGPFLPPQQNLPSFILPSYQQEQPTGPINPNNPAPPPNSQDPFQVQMLHLKQVSARTLTVLESRTSFTCP